MEGVHARGLKSLIRNALIRDAEPYFEAENFRLPPFAAWTPEHWANPDGDISEIVDRGQCVSTRSPIERDAVVFGNGRGR